MPRYRDEAPAVRVYTVCDESKYLIVRNVPALGCGDELWKLFATYGEVEECKPMDEEDCEPFTDVYWIKFCLFNNARFAKRKLDEFAFLGNRLQVSYAPQFESVSDTKEKLECRRTEVLGRLNPKRTKGSIVHDPGASNASSVASPAQTFTPQQRNPNQKLLTLDYRNLEHISLINGPPPITRVSSDQDYFPSQSMNQTVHLVREKLNKIQSSAEHLQAGSVAKKPRVDNRRRI